MYQCYEHLRVLPSVRAHSQSEFRPGRSQRSRTNQLGGASASRYMIGLEYAERRIRVSFCHVTFAYSHGERGREMQKKYSSQPGTQPENTGGQRHSAAPNLKELLVSAVFYALCLRLVIISAKYGRTEVGIHGPDMSAWTLRSIRKQFI